MQLVRNLVPLLRSMTVYARVGDWVSPLSVAAVAGMLVLSVYRRRAPTAEPGDNG